MTNADQLKLEQQGSLIELRRFLKILEYLCLDAFIATVIITLFFRDNQLLLTLDAAFLASFVFLFLFNWQYFSYRDKAERDKKYEQLIEPLTESTSRIQLERENALRYCQQLVEDYTKTRGNARNLYYFFQMSTIIFSGVTPVLVLVDKLDTNKTSFWIAWLPVIFPAIASIVASIATSFPLETIWKESNSIVENLEAEQQKFILGINNDTVLELNSPIVPESSETPEEQQQTAQQIQLQEKRAKRAIVEFINKINEIHLKQITAQVEKLKEQTENPPQEENT
ncbi:DUF4231 domain-containing protein [Aphanothece sacrum]|uniref:DUF4231 domain-containing protein n=1 Tax=Aphanothece sacrum FPU1 TaxID=1920663 RepID=A0A401ICN9_APHSA|nr:DUF4231 domain-containing protein [Aphanothece sacrum]GBF79058.1 hypothetical protein AsFPU1_0450 [Aphanothece sacrum FPU1]GBF86017.1 hypothetical protein AsFPU3_3087 [Aphanothece sacrum FPU3]